MGIRRRDRHGPSPQLVLPFVVTGCAGGVTGVLGTVYWQEQVRWYRACVPDEAVWFSCLGWWPYHLAIGVPAMVAVIWIVAEIANVHLAPVVATGGAAVALLGLGVFEATVDGIQVPPVWLGAVLGASGYVVATFVFLAGIRFRIRVSVLGILGLLMVMTSAVGK